jgi:O-acetyl-ADP-ribose deacetylase (regulator of RNase III)
MLRFEVGKACVEFRRGDITRASDVGDLAVIANAANSHLIGGGGVDGAIHRAAGPRLAQALDEVRGRLPGGHLPAGGAVVTPGFDLPVGHVIHCVGPVYSREGDRAPALLRSAYVEALRICRENGFDSVAFPAISTGVYGYPLDEAAAIAWDAVRSELATHGKPTLVRFVLFDERVLSVFASVAGRPMSD